MTRRRPAWAGLVAAAALVAPAGAADERAEPVSAIQSHFNGKRLDGPMGVFYDRVAGELFVADTRNGLVAIFDPEGMPKFTFGPEAGIIEPRRVMADGSDRIYVIGTQEGVSVFSFRGEPVGAFPFTDREGPIAVQAVAMARDPAGRLLFADQAGRRVLVYDEAWSFLLSFGHPGKGDGTFASLMDVAVGPEGEIAVSDRSARPVQVFSADGRFLRGWGEHDLGHQNFSAPAGLDVDAQGRVFIADTLRQDVKVFDRDGTFLFHFGGLGSGAGQVAYPVDVAVGGSGDVYVCEKVGRRVQRFRLVESSPPLGDQRDVPPAER